MTAIAGFIGKDPVTIKCILTEWVKGIHLAEGAFGEWGAVYYQSGDLLLKSHPFACGKTESLLEMLAGADTQLLLLHVGSSSASSHSRWNMQPFRYRNWVYVQHGRIEGFSRIREAVIDVMPDFLGRSLKGTSDAESIFHLILSFLYDGGYLEKRELERNVIFGAMKHSIEFLKRTCEKYGCKDFSISMLISNGVMLSGYNSFHEGKISIFEGRGNCTNCSVKEKCLLLRRNLSTRAGIVLILNKFPLNVDEYNFSPISEDTFFMINRDITVDSVPARASII